MTKEILIKHIKENTPKNYKGKYYALMLFKTEIELNISNIPNKWVNVANNIYINGSEALNAYANTPNPASQLIDANTPENLANKMIQMIDNFNDINWLNNELYPYM